MRKLWLVIVISLNIGLSQPVMGQYSLSAIGTGTTVNFNSGTNNTNCTYAGDTWTDNSTIPNVYSNRVVYFSSTGCHNTGGLHLYGASNSDRAIGARGSGSVANVTYGVRFKNNTGVTVTSLKIEFRNEHWGNANPSSANHALNVHLFSYQISASAFTNVTTGSYITTGLTVAGALDVRPVENTDGSAGSTMTAINGNVMFVNRVGCIDLSLAAGSEIMLRWVETDNTNNDHNMGVDDLVVTPYVSPCNIVLPVNITDFFASKLNNSISLGWFTESENNVSYYEIQKSSDGIGFNPLTTIDAKTDGRNNSYMASDESPIYGINYYKIYNVDNDGIKQFQKILLFDFNEHINSMYTIRYGDGEVWLNIKELSSATSVQLYSLSGLLIASYAFDENANGLLKFDRDELAKGMYLLRIVQGNKIYNDKLIIQ